MTGVRPGVEAAELAGLWVTSYVVDGLHHADLSVLSVTRGGVFGEELCPPARAWRARCAATPMTSMPVCLAGT